METFGYVFVLVSIVVGLGVAHILAGVGRIIQHPGRYRTDWVHLVWVAFMFTYLLAFWWWQYGYVGVREWTFYLYAFIVGYAVLLYLLCVVLLPEDLGSYPSFREYFMGRRRWFFGLYAATFVVDAGDTLAKGMDHAASMSAEYWIQLAVLFLASLMALRSSNRPFHAVFAVFNFVYTIHYLLRALSVARA